MQNTAEHRKNDGYNVIPIYEDRNSMVSYRGADDIRQRAEHTRERREERLARRIAGYVREELENCTAVVWNMPEEEPMAYERTRVLVGKTKDGKPIYKQVSGKTQDERNDEIVKAYIQSGRIREFNDLLTAVGIAVDGNETASMAQGMRGSITFSDYAQEWFERYKHGQLEESTEYQLWRRVTALQEWFKDKPLTSMTTDDIQDFFKERANQSKKTLATFNGTIREILTFAEEERLIPDGAILWRRIKVGGVDKKTRRAGSIEEYKHILSQLDILTDPVEHLSVAILAYTAIHPEELRGLRWEDIDFERNQIRIERAIPYGGKGNRAICKGTKTISSNAAIPMNDDLRIRLLKHQQDSGWIIHDENGEPFATGYRWRKLWKSISGHIDLHGLNPAEFRKTVATVMNALGADPKSIQRLLRHKKLDTTMNVYTEVDMTTFADNCNMLTRIA